MKHILLLLILVVNSISFAARPTYVIKVKEPDELSSKELKKCHTIDLGFSRGSLEGQSAVGIVQGVEDKKDLLEDLKKCDYINADGTKLSKELFPKLFSVVNCSYGCSAKEFSVPDLRGSFVRSNLKGPSK